MLHPVAPHYSTLLRFDPQNYPKIVGDVAESWSFSRDGLTLTVKIRKGIKFHDGTPLTAQDVKATYDKIIFPPEGVASARKALYVMVDKVEAPDDSTVVFKLKHIAASFLANLASPWNFIYSAERLKKDPRWYEKNVMGSGPFIFGEHVAGSHWTGKKNPNYFMPGRPYLDSFRAIFIRDTAPRVAAVRSGQAIVEFRGFNPAARDDIVKTLGNKAVVQESPWACNILVTLNNEKKPFSDARVRRALTLAIDRNEASKALSQISVMKYVGGVFRPGSEFATPPAELVKLPGFGKDINAARAEAKKLLKEAGVPEGFSFVLKNRNVKEPYEVSGVYVVDQWRKIGLNVTHMPLEGGPVFQRSAPGKFRRGRRFRLRVHGRARSLSAQVPEQRSQPGELRALQRRDSRRALRAAEPHARSERTLAAYPANGKARHRRASLSIPAALVAADCAAQQPAQGLENRAEPLREPRPARRVAGAVKKLKMQN